VSVLEDDSSTALGAQPSGSVQSPAGKKKKLKRRRRKRVAVLEEETAGDGDSEGVGRGTEDAVPLDDVIQETLDGAASSSDARLSSDSSFQHLTSVGEEGEGEEGESLAPSIALEVPVTAQEQQEEEEEDGAGKEERKRAALELFQEFMSDEDDVDRIFREEKRRRQIEIEARKDMESLAPREVDEKQLMEFIRNPKKGMPKIRESIVLPEDQCSTSPPFLPAVEWDGYVSVMWDELQAELDRERVFLEALDDPREIFETLSFLVTPKQQSVIKEAELQDPEFEKRAQRKFDKMRQDMLDKVKSKPADFLYQASEVKTSEDRRRLVDALVTINSPSGFETIESNPGAEMEIGELMRDKVKEREEAWMKEVGQRHDENGIPIAGFMHGCWESDKNKTVEARVAEWDSKETPRWGFFKNPPFQEPTDEEIYEILAKQRLRQEKQVLETDSRIEKMTEDLMFRPENATAAQEVLETLEEIDLPEDMKIKALRERREAAEEEQGIIVSFWQSLVGRGNEQGVMFLGIETAYLQIGHGVLLITLALMSNLYYDQNILFSLPDAWRTALAQGVTIVASVNLAMAFQARKAAIERQLSPLFWFLKTAALGTLSWRQLMQTRTIAEKKQLRDARKKKRADRLAREAQEREASKRKKKSRTSASGSKRREKQKVLD